MIWILREDRHKGVMILNKRSLKPLSMILFLAEGLLFSGATLAPGREGIDARRINTVEMERQIDDIMMPLVKDNLLSGTVLVAVNDALLFHKAYGMADIEAGVPNTIDTEFGLASITKMFTALAIMQLVERGQLRLEDRLSQYIPDFPSGERISIYHLLTHTSGLPSYNSLEKYANFQALIGRIKTLPLKFDTGASFEYSNSGYALLTFVIEKISGVTYEDYMKRNIFVPCQMIHSGIIRTDGPMPSAPQAVGYSLTGSGRLQRSELRHNVAKGDGALFSTTGDMFKFNRALFNNSLVSKKSRDMMFRPFKEQYGIGFLVEDYNGWTAIWHPGGKQGARTKFTTYIKPNHKVTVVSLFNTDFMLDYLVEEQIEKIALGELGKPIFSRNASFIRPLKKFTGTYEIEPGDTFTITVDKGRIYYQGQGQERYEAFPFNDRSIYIKNINSRYHFREDKTNKKITAVGFIGTSATAFMVEAQLIKK